MKRLLILDQWYGVSGGASKAVLYEELSQHFALTVLKLPDSRIEKWLTYIKTFHPDINQWKARKGRRDETLTKYPDTFRRVTARYNKMIARYHQPYDALLQIGSLFGPVYNPRNVPYFSYSDSTVYNPHQMWPDWMPDDFDDFAKQWYGLERKMFQTMTRIMVYSDFVKQTLCGHYGIEADKIHVVGSSLKIPEDYTIDWSRRDRRVVFVSTDFKRKGGYKIPEVYARVQKEVPDVKFIMLGSVPEDFPSQVSSGIELAGAVDKAQLKREYALASVIVHPAEYDPFPSVLLEAANFEVPAVASRICGIPEIVKDEVSGYLVDKDDMDGFASRIVTLLQDRQRNEMMGKSAKHYVQEKFHPQAVAGRMRGVVDRD